MKKSQRIMKIKSDLTTPEQSQRLLELGVPSWTANHYYYDFAWVNGEYPGAQPQVCNRQLFESEDLRRKDEIFPCWSAFRLMQVLDICDTSYIKDDWPRQEEVAEKLGCDYIEYLVRTFELMRKRLDFSKLEK